MKSNIKCLVEIGFTMAVRMRLLLASANKGNHSPRRPRVVWSAAWRVRGGGERHCSAAAMPSNLYAERNAFEKPGIGARLMSRETTARRPGGAA